MLNLFSMFAKHAEFFQHVLFDKNSPFYFSPSISLELISPKRGKLQSWTKNTDVEIISRARLKKKLIEGPVQEITNDYRD